MSYSPFSTLPQELICRVFESVDDFSVVAALAQTARIFYHTWREYRVSISRVVAPRVILNLDDAERLLDMQEAAEAVNQSEDVREDASAIRVKRLIFNSRCASAAINDWVKICRIHCYHMYRRGGDPHMRPSEIARFERSFYRVWTIGVMGSASHLQHKASAFLDKCSPQELCRLYELSEWARCYNNHDFGPPGFDLRDKVWRTGYELVKQRWYAYQDGKLGVPSKIRGPPNDEGPFDFFAFFDHTQHYVELH